MAVNKTIADKGSNVIVNGKIRAPPVVGPRPGNTPNIKPNNVPKIKTIINLELIKGANIKERFSILYFVINISDYTWRKS